MAATKKVVDDSKRTVTYWYYGSYKTKPPTGIKITRNGSKFTTSWKKAEPDYGVSFRVTMEGQRKIGVGLSWSVVGGLVDKGISQDLTSIVYSVTGGVQSLHPYKQGATMDRFSFFVQAARADFTEKAGYTEGVYVTKDVVSNGQIRKQSKYERYDVYRFYYANQFGSAAKYYELAAPYAAKSLAADLTGLNKTTFTWQFADKIDGSGKDHWSTRYQWESQVLRDSSITDGSKLSWLNGNWGNHYTTGTTTAAVSEKSFTESAADTFGAGFKTDYTVTRWFRIRAQGPAGDSAWKYAKHVYAIPAKPTITGNKVTFNNSGLLAWVGWRLKSLSLRPVDTVKVQYLIGVPNANVAAPTDGWSDAPGGTIENVSTTQALTFSLTTKPALDNCMWARVVAIHDETDISYSNPVLMYKNKLETPTGLSVTINATTHKATEIRATNNSSVPDSFLVVTYVDKKNPKGKDIAIIPHGESSVTNIQCPNWGANVPSFSVRAVVGTYTSTKKSGVTYYTVTSKMTSAVQTDGGDVPKPPATVTVTQADLPNTLNVKWAWTWAAATEAEISWADHEDAWMSTSGPSTYVVDASNLPNWNISGIDTGKTWYVRVRLGEDNGESVVYGPYSSTEEISMGSEPQAVSMYLSKTVIKSTETVTAYWGFTSDDNSTQASAEVAVVTVSGGTASYKRIASVKSEQQAVLNAKKLKWTTGATYNLALRVTSSSGKRSEWSSPVSITIADPISVRITADSFVHNKEIIADGETGETRTITALTELPLSVTLSAPVLNTVVATISRLGEYRITRPDGSVLNGYSDEVIAYTTRANSNSIVIDQNSLVGFLDDGAAYRLTVTVSDSFGQSDTDSIDFEVCWDHQALMPQGTAELESEVAILSPIPPNGLQEGDVCDIYRLSTDSPELVYEGATFGETYVDPYPTIGESGGYRFVFRTPYGDFITADNEIAWVDVPLVYETIDNIIDFDGHTARITYNVDLSNNWTKDFKETQYLGGSVQGDWNAAIGRTLSITGVVPLEDQESIETMRQLANHPGICRVRTRDGSNFTADVQVSESRGHEPGDIFASYTLNVTRVDPETPAGILYDDWEH